MIKQTGLAIATAVAIAYAGHAQAGQYNQITTEVVPLSQRSALVANQLRRSDEDGTYLSKDIVGFSYKLTDDLKVMLAYGTQESKNRTDIASGHITYDKKLGRFKVSLSEELRYDLDEGEIIRYNTLLKAGTQVKIGGVTLNPRLVDLVQLTGDGDLLENRITAGIGVKLGALEVGADAGYSDWKLGRDDKDGFAYGITAKVNMLKAAEAASKLMRSRRRTDQRRGR